MFIEIKQAKQYQTIVYEGALNKACSVCPLANQQDYFNTE